MSSKSQYNTRHRQELLQYLQTMAGQHVTVTSIAEHFQKQGVAIGVATIYRHLDRMVSEGIVNKYILDNTSPACFEYVATSPEHHSSACLHLKCEHCGKVIHLHCHELEQMQAHLLHSHNFTLNPLRTVLYGLCDTCRNRLSEQ